MVYLEETQKLYQEIKSQGLIDSAAYDEKRQTLFERHATPLILKQGDKFRTGDVVAELGIATTSLGPEKQWMQSLLERMTRKGPINGRMLFQSPDRPQRFFWIEEE